MDDDGAFPVVKSRLLQWRVLKRDSIRAYSKVAAWTVAATGAAAAEVLAPTLTTLGSAEIYVQADTMAQIEAMARKAGLKQIDGGRLTLKPFPTMTSSVLASVVGGIRVVPWPRVYADLRLVGVRGEDAAEHLREVMRGR